MTASAHIRFVRVGFAITKLRAGSDSFFLLRYNPKWHDLNLIGGHEDRKDAGNLERTARRELREEVPLIRMFHNYRLEKLVGPVSHGPILSKSKNELSNYEAHFYLVMIDSSPAPLVHMLTSRSKNIWVNQQDMMAGSRFRLSTYVNLLSNNIDGGLRAIPYSSPTNLISIRNHFEGIGGNQMKFYF